jgi:hypothetical protein
MRCKGKLAAAIAVVLTMAFASAARAAVVTDSFTGTNGTLLENHTGETGAAWTYHPNYPADLTLLNGRVWGPEWGLYFASGVPPTNEYDVSADLTVLSNSGAIGVVGRSLTTGADSLYMGRYNATNARWELVICQSTGCQNLDQSPQTLAIGATYALKLEIRNASKRLYVDGMLRASSTDNTIAQVGRAGIRSGPGVTTSTTGYHLDNFSVTVPAATDTSITAGPSGPTNNASPSFSFSSVPAGGTFECRLDGPGGAVGAWGACTNPKAYASLAEGSYTFNVRATVGGSTDSSPATRAFTVDTTAPDTSITAGPSGPTNNASPSFSFSSTEGGSTFECRLDGPGGATGTYAACASPNAYSGLAAGSYTFNVRARDTAGNQDASAATRAFTVDTTAPDTTISSGPTGTITVSSASFGFTSEAGATFECQLNGPGGTVGTYAACTSPKAYSGLANGSYTFNVRATDTAGNVDPSPGSRAFTVAVPGCTFSAATFTVSGCPLIKSDTAAAADPTPLWGKIDCATTGQHQQLTTGGDPHPVGDGTSQGNTSLRRLTAYDSSPGSLYDNYGERCELGKNDWRTQFTPATFNVYNEFEHRITFFSLRLPDSYPLANTFWQVVMQMKSAAPSDANVGSPAIGLHAEAGEWRLFQTTDHNPSTTTVLKWATAAQKNVWTRFAFDVVYAKDGPPGSLKVYVDLNGDGDALDAGEQSPAITNYTLYQEPADTQPADGDPILAGSATPSHLRAGMYHADDVWGPGNNPIPCPVASGGCSVDVDHVQVYNAGP